MVEQGHQPGGFGNSRAFPLLVSADTEAALVRFQADRSMTRGKALNVIIQEGLMSLNYMRRPETPKTPEQLRKEADAREADWVKLHWFEMSEKARSYWGQQHPEAVPLAGGTLSK